MCGIVCYVGKSNCRRFVMEGLARLEYRGYDSAGFVCIDAKHGHLSFTKAQGKLAVLQKKLAATDHDGAVGMGHTRWATHGIANEVNAHPHFDCQKSIAVVHNGIIESHGSIRKQLLAEGHQFYSSTDTEVIAHLFESILPFHKTLHSAVTKLVKQLNGAYALAILLEKYPNTLIVIRRKSPLCIGMGKKEMFVASDPLVFSDRTDRTIFLPDSSFAIVSASRVDLYDFSANRLPVTVTKFDAKFAQATKQGFKHYMLKEIYEQKQAIGRTIRFYHSLCESKNTMIGSSHRSEVKDPLWRQLNLSSKKIKNLRTLHLIGAGTSWHAARIAQFFFETICKLPTYVHLASEFRFMPFFPEEESVYIFISQSGETADTLEALRLVNDAKVPTIALTNVSSSTIVQEAQGFLLMQAGPEISVASTKAFTCMLASLYWLAHKIALERGLIGYNNLIAAEEDLLVAAEILESIIENYKIEITQHLAKKYAQFDRFIFLGRHISYPFAMEAALKLKEISYVFAQCYPSGELKHGALALIDEKTPVMIFSVLDHVIYDKIVSNAQEVKARRGHLISFAFEGQEELISLSDYAFKIPRVKPLLGPLAMAGLMQFFVYQITCELGLPVDQPRNLAKSVTVE